MQKDNRKLTPFEDKLAEVIVSNQGLLTFDACVDAAVQDAPSLLWFAKEGLKEQENAPITEEFLLENGFKKQLDGSYVYATYFEWHGVERPQDYINVCLTDDVLPSYMTHTYLEGTPEYLQRNVFEGKIKNIKHLQEAMSVCGIEKELKV